MAKFQRHIFTCINQRPADNPKGCCAARGGAEVAAELKRRLYERGYKRVIRANKAYCLDQCSKGVAMVVYPDAVWYGGVTVDDLDEIIESHVVNGMPVERLVIPDHQLTGLDCALRAALGTRESPAPETDATSVGETPRGAEEPRT